MADRALLKLHGPGAEGISAIVDREDLAVCENLGNWRISQAGYAEIITMVHGKRKHLFLHHFIMGKPSDGLQTDHINRVKLDNRRENLRFATRSENMLNRDPYVRLKGQPKHGYRGVELNYVGNYRAYIKRGNKRYRSGAFPTAREAAKAYNLLATGIHGDKAILNSI